MPRVIRIEQPASAATRRLTLSPAAASAARSAAIMQAPPLRPKPGPGHPGRLVRAARARRRVQFHRVLEIDAVRVTR